MQTSIGLGDFRKRFRTLTFSSANIRYSIKDGGVEEGGRRREEWGSGEGRGGVAATSGFSLLSQWFDYEYYSACGLRCTLHTA